MGNKPTGKLGKRGRKLRNIKEEFAGDRPIYEHQPKESARAFLAFTVYRDAGVTRTIKSSVSEYQNRAGLKGRSESTAFNQMMKWSARWRWRERIVEWDRFLDKHKRKLALRDVEKMRERHAKLGESLQSLGAMELKKWLDKIKKEINEKGNSAEAILTVNDLIRALESGVKLERASRGEPESIIEERHQISSDELREQMRSVVTDKEALKFVDKIMDRLNETTANRS